MLQRRLVLPNTGGVNLHSKAQVMGAMPAWFRECVNNLYQKMHGVGHEAAFHTANTSMPVLGSISLPHIISNGRRALCSTVHVSKSEICMCTQKMMEVPFKVRYSTADANVFVCSFHHGG